MIRTIVVPALAALVGLSSRAAFAQPPAPAFAARAAVQVESAQGRLTGPFRNVLAGLRVDLVFAPRVSGGAYVGYANLKGKEGRAHALLSYAQVEYQAPLAPHLLNLRVPLRFGTGYLSHNGPVVRASTGLAIALSPTIDLVSELLAPMVWVTNNQTLLSMNLALELAARF